MTPRPPRPCSPAATRTWCRWRGRSLPIRTSSTRRRSTAIVPRRPPIPGLDHPKVASYVEIVEGRKIAGKRVALVGAGGIGFDVAELLTADGAADGHLSDGHADDPAIAAFRDEWGID